MRAVIQSFALALAFVYIGASAQPNQVQYGGLPNPNINQNPNAVSQGPVSTGPASVTGSPGNPQSVTGGGSFFGGTSASPSPGRSTGSGNSGLSGGSTGNSGGNAVTSGSPQVNPSPSFENP